MLFSFLNLKLFHHQNLKLGFGALIIGLLVGLTSVGFIKFIAFVQTVLWGQHGALFATLLREHAQPWLLLIFLPLGGIASALIITYLIPENRQMGIADVIEANALRAGRLSSRSAFFATLAAGLSIGSGASVGREGPMVHLGSAMASLAARSLFLDRKHTRCLLGCGAAAAIGASFNAPLAGILFALEVIIGNFSIGASAQIALAAVVGTGVRHTLLGNGAVFTLPELEVLTWFAALPAFALGILSGGFAALFLWILPKVRGFYKRIKTPLWIKAGSTGFLVALIGLALPDALGLGYEATNVALLGKLGIITALLLLVAKLLFTALCLGAGFSGGVVSPALFLGAMLGHAFGLTWLSLNSASDPTLFTMVGMAAVTAPIVGSPLSTILIVFELTTSYEVLLAVMSGVVASTLTARLLSGHSFFITQLIERGLSLKSSHDISGLSTSPVSALMDTDFTKITADCLDAKRLLQESRFGWGIVCDNKEQFLGVISLEFTDFSKKKPASILARSCLTLSQKDTLMDAMRAFRSTEEPHLPVIEEGRVIAQIHEADLLRAYEDSLAEIEGAHIIEDMISQKKR